MSELSRCATFCAREERDEKCEISQDDCPQGFVFTIAHKKGTTTVLAQNEGQNPELLMSKVLRLCSQFGIEVISVVYERNDAEDWTELLAEID